MKKEERNAQQVLEDELISIGIFTKELAANPTEALSEIISWHCDVALNPAISSDAQIMEKRAFNRGYKRGKDDFIAKLEEYLDQQ